MARAGADVVINYNSHREEADSVAQEVAEIGRRAIVCQADASNRADVDRMVAAAMEEFGKIDICVCNAASTTRKPFLELTTEDFEWVIGVSCTSVFNASHACAKEMVKRGEGGAILVISSVMGEIPFSNSVPYNTCKAAINHMANTIADELISERIRVNVIAPGWIDTPGERRFTPEDEIYQIASDLPWGRLGKIEEIGKAAVFICSDDAEYITAANLRVDGGFILPCNKLNKSY
jgi:glucose 1-dehydrogenase